MMVMLWVLLDLVIIHHMHHGQATITAFKDGRQIQRPCFWQLKIIGLEPEIFLAFKM